MGRLHATPADCSVSGCKWPVAREIQVPQHWQSGGYILHVLARYEGGQCIEHHFPFIIRSRSPSSPEA
ncbi:N,N-dimethylformamidase beta subunit family domain-containing protein, partial [Klebsiella pneumoniae]